MSETKIQLLVVLVVAPVVFLACWPDWDGLGSGSDFRVGEQVVGRTVNVRIGPSFEAAVTNKLYAGQRLETFEVRGDWARISPYYDGSLEGVSGQVARWIPVQSLRREG